MNCLCEPQNFLHFNSSYFVLDHLPDDPGHLITVKLHNGILDLDLFDP